jgi:uncharacterized membrane protein YcfT
LETPLPDSLPLPQERLHDLDAVRCIAMMLDVVLHATESFAPGMTENGFPIVDQYQSDEIGLLLFVIHIFRMATCFLIVGFFFHLVLHRKGQNISSRIDEVASSIHYCSGGSLLLLTI